MGADPRARPEREAAGVHVCHVFSSFNAGGAQVRTSIVMNGLPEGYRHTVIALDDQWGCGERLRPGLAVRYLPSERRKGRLPYVFRIGGILRRLRPDLLVTYNWGTMDAAIAAACLRIRPWIHVEDGFGPDEAVRQLRRRMVARRLLFRRSAAVVVCSRNLLRLALETWGPVKGKLAYIPNGIDTVRFAPAPGGALRGTLGIPPGAVVVGMVAALRTEKNPMRLLEAFASLASRMPAAHLLFVGQNVGDVLPPLTRRVAELGLPERVHFVGRVADPLPYYREIDLFALSSDTEQMPLCVAEAMSCARPVLATDVGDVGWMVAEENRPFVTPVADSAAYVGAMETLLRDASLRRALGEANRARAVAEFDQRRMVAAYREAYDRACGRAAAG